MAIIEPWDIDCFPLKVGAFDPRKPVSPNWAEQKPKPVLRSGDEGNVFREGPSEHDHQTDAMSWTPDSHGAAGVPINSDYIHERTNHYDDYDDDDDERREPANYHVVTGPIGSGNRDDWTEHNYTMFEHPDADYDPEGAQVYFEEDHPEYNPERNPDVQHEVIHVHPAEGHDAWHSNLRAE